MNNKDQMHPDDFRNLVIFAVVSMLLWYAWDTFILKPQKSQFEKAKLARHELILNNPELLEPLSFLSREEALDTTRSSRISFENNRVKGSILLKGGRLDDLVLKEYFDKQDSKQNVALLTPEGTERPRFVEFGWYSSDEKVKLPDDKTIWTVRGNSDLKPGAPVTLAWDNGQGQTFERTMTLDKHYSFKFEQSVHNSNIEPVQVFPYALIVQYGIPMDFTGRWVAYEGPMGFMGGELVKGDYHTLLSERKISREAQTGWLGISDKYWLTALIPQQENLAKYRFLVEPDPVHKEKNRYQADLTGQLVKVGHNETKKDSFTLFTGIKKVSVLEAYEVDLKAPNFDLAVDFGWFWFFTYPFYIALHYLGVWTGNMGVAIICLTIFLRMAVYPLTRTTFHSFAKMRVVQPQILEIRSKFANDKERLQQEIVEVYRKHGVNPLSGCLPALVQIPIFFALYKIILVTIELRNAPFFGWIQDLSAPDPTSLFNLFGLIPWTPPGVLMVGAWPCAMLCVMLVQKQLTPPPQDQIQKDMRNYFPFIITYIMAQFPAGLVVYWTFSGLISALQQAYIMKSMGVPIHLFEKDKVEAELEKKVEEGPPVHPLIEMAEEEAEHALFGEEGRTSSEPGEPEKPVKPPKPKKKKKK
ncbi:MAG: membrane protein insertase YidC [Alphaproteobacteria bacterium]|nr:membrane protein insertase YidC [Alphaproteobacteria bacterium]MCB9975789.1 membrane protein insertase YidC [Rhodospirillales bacterium]